MGLIVFFLALLTIVLVYMTMWFAVALYTKRYDVVDSAWGLGFVLVAWVSIAIQQQSSVVSVVSASLVSVWGIRLFAHIARRNWRKTEDDHRYQALRAGWGSAEKRKAYTNVFLLQGALLILVSLPMIAIARTATTSLNVGIIIGWVVWVFGIGFEALADYQLATFLSTRPAKSHALMDRGLWRYSRHPNYFGEVTTWWGAAITSLSVGGWWGVLGALTITFLIVKISGIPPLEKHYAGNKEYQAYAKRTSVLVPLPPKQV